MTHRTIVSLVIAGSILHVGCSPASEPEEPAEPDMALDRVDMTMEDRDAADDLSPELDQADAQAEEMEEVARCVSEDGMSEAEVGEELCQEGVRYECRPNLTLKSLERTCEPVEVDIQLGKLYSKNAAPFGIYGVSYGFTITNVGTGTSRGMLCEMRDTDDGFASGWINILESAQFMLGPGEEYKVDDHLDKWMSDETISGTIELRCTVDNEEGVAAELGNTATIPYTY